MKEEDAKILVLDGRSLASLAIVRSLGSKGFEVHCGESFQNNLTSYSKYVTESFVYPSSKKKPKAFIEVILERVKKENYDLLIPARDDTTLMLSKYKDELNDYTSVYLAGYYKIQKLNDKGKTVKLAQKADVPVPKTYFPEEMELEEIKKEIDYPVLIRPNVGSGSRGIKFVKSKKDFDEKYREVYERFDGCIVQSFIQKKGYSTACILMGEAQKTIASFTYERTKEYPVTGGPTVVGVSNDDKLAKKNAINLLKEVDWKGPAEVEFIIDEDDNLLLLEVNPRFWMPLNLAIKSGVDFPHLLYKLSKNKEVGPVERYEKGVKYRWLLPNEFLWLISEKRNHEEIREFFDLWNGRTYFGSLSKKDPLPVVGTITQSLDFVMDKEKRKQVLDRGW